MDSLLCDLLILIVFFLDPTSYDCFRRTCRAYHDLLESKQCIEYCFKNYCIQEWKKYALIEVLDGSKYMNLCNVQKVTERTWLDLANCFYRGSDEIFSHDDSIIIRRPQKGSGTRIFPHSLEDFVHITEGQYVGTLERRIQNHILDDLSNDFIYRGDLLGQESGTLLIHGKGKSIYSTRNISYEGGFNCREFHGKGKITYLDTDETYESRWIHGIPMGDVNCQKIKQSIEDGICINNLRSLYKGPYKTYRLSKHGYQDRVVCESCLEHCSQQYSYIHMAEFEFRPCVCYCNVGTVKLMDRIRSDEDIFEMFNREIQAFQ
jgi:hypothetical protein